MASMGLSLDEQKAIDRFRSSVVEPSMTKLVVLDFWAEWCGPCKALTPVLEKVCGEYADKGVVLAKVNVDEDQFIAAQFQVRSIPTVYAMFQGQPVADLTNARSESQLRQTLDQILAQLPVEPGAVEGEPATPDVAQFVAMGEEVLAEGDGARAATIFAGPAFNFVFAIAVFWALMVAGELGDRPLVGEVVPDSPAAKAVAWRSRLAAAPIRCLPLRSRSPRKSHLVQGCLSVAVRPSLPG